MTSMLKGLPGLIYLVVGLVIASQHNYLSHLAHLKPIVSAVLAIAAWPLVLIGVDLHIH